MTDAHEDPSSDAYTVSDIDASYFDLQDELETEGVAPPLAEPVPVLTEWLPTDGTVPKGMFLGVLRTSGEGGVRYKTMALEGQLNRVYNPQTGRRMKFAEGSALTHYMVLPAPPQVGAHQLQ